MSGHTSAGKLSSKSGGNSSISLADKQQINVSQQSPKMLKMASEGFFHALLLLFTSFSQNLTLGAPAFPLDYSDLSGG